MRNLYLTFQLTTGNVSVIVYDHELGFDYRSKMSFREISYSVNNTFETQLVFSVLQT